MRPPDSLLPLDIMLRVASLSQVDKANLAVASRGTAELVRGHRLQGVTQQGDVLRTLVAKFLLRNMTVVNAICINTGLSVYGLVKEFVDCIGPGTVNSVVAYHDRHGDTNRISHVSAKEFSLTCRTLALDRFLRLPGRKNSYVLPWSTLEGPDNYLACLGLDAATLRGWCGKSVLDAACGGSLFYAEASVAFGINVTPIDLNPQTDRIREVLALYAKNMLFLEFLRKERALGSCGVQTPDDEVFSALIRELSAIVSYYRHHPVQRGDVMKLTFAPNTFDVCLSSYLFTYLSDEAKEKALTELVRVTRVGGEIRICPGMQAMDPHSLGIDGQIITNLNERLPRSVGKSIELAFNDGHLYIFRVNDAKTCAVM